MTGIKPLNWRNTPLTQMSDTHSFSMRTGVIWRNGKEDGCCAAWNDKFSSDNRLSDDDVICVTMTTIGDVNVTYKGWTCEVFAGLSVSRKWLVIDLGVKCISIKSSGNNFCHHIDFKY